MWNLDLDPRLYRRFSWIQLYPCVRLSIIPYSQDWFIRSSHRMCSVKKGVLRYFAKLTGKYLCQSLFFNKVTGLTPATLLKKKLWYRCFPVNFVKFLTAPFLQNTSGQLFLAQLVKLVLNKNTKVTKTFFWGKSYSIQNVINGAFFGLKSAFLNFFVKLLIRFFWSCTWSQAMKSG